MTIKVALPFLLLGATRAAVQCGNFVCFHNSRCIDGPPDFSSHPDGVDGDPLDFHDFGNLGEHCYCGPLYTGVDCSVPVDNCKDGSHQCYNGGVCLTDSPDQLPYCDCTEAIDLSTGRPYVGQFCEQKAPAENESGFCSKVDVKTFCLNGGTCNSAFPTASDLPCLCGEDFKGPHCEFPNVPTVRSCTLTCQNGGLCRLGEDPDPSQVSNYQDINLDDKMRCECPQGYSGEFCEVQTSACGGIECLNGGTCRTATDSSGKTEPYCDCKTSYVPSEMSYFAGEYCQHAMTQFCESTSDGDAIFCTNGGDCNTQNPRAGCICPDNAVGLKCEYVQEKDCTLECINGQCKVGEPPEYSSSYEIYLSSKNHHDFQYCECDSGFSGKVCEIEQDNACSDFACLNGGQCIVDDIDGTVSYSCNCLSASDDANGLYYDGRYCQFTSTSICFDDVESNEIYFCMNNGQCQADYEKGCVCPEGYAGFSCEFVEGKDCTLDCQNDGKCVLGTPPGESKVHAYWFNAEDYKNWQYCDCPAGYSGALCEAEVKDCGSFECLNGGSCYKEDGVTRMDGERCNCLEAYDPVGDGVYFDGRFCQFPSTSICFEGVVDGQAQSFFCMNDGQCQDDYLKGCICPEGFAGFSCEFLEAVDCQEDCGEHGTCRLGAPPTGSHAHAYWFDPNAQADFEYCQCEPGWGGKYCDEQGDDCGEFTCLNGGSCFDNHGKAMVDRCNCLSAQVDDGLGGTTYYDGRFCQYASTDVCFEGEVDGEEQSFFCMNDGQCQQNYLDGCKCPDGFSGFSCEFIEGTDCTLDCGEDGECRLGSPPGSSHAHAYWFNSDEQDNYQYCECLNGAGGQYCDVKGEDCGLFTCLNGGRCFDEDGVTPMVDRCNCLEAWKPGNPNVYYDGRFCQYASTSVCLETDDESFFCMNGGTCSSSDPANVGCSCPDGFAGFSCEFIEGTDCNLECQNGGTCRLGAPPGGSHAHAYWYDADAQENYQYCECATGFGGKFCESVGQSCGDFTCLNGGTCDSTLPDRCNCLNAYEEGEGSIPTTFYDGRFCQYASTSVCEEETADGQSYFCMNDGQCRRDVLQGCDCPDGFSGFSCEFIEGTDCTLDCGRGTCKLGSPPDEDYLHAYWYDPDAQDKYQYCECPSGTNGKNCEATAVDCGDYTCLNGGKCTSEAGAAMNGRCNCIEAFDPVTDTYFDGLYCQYASTSVCYENGDEAYFCMNGGKCAEEDFTLGCDCTAGFGGFYCEFKDPQDCTLDCKNGGTCVLGSEPDVSVDDAYWYNPEKEDQYQYCQCADGFSGPLCESSGNEKCGDSECFNGGTCITRTIDGREVNHCDCRDASHAGKYYAGSYCQYEATAICNVSGSSAFFCVNNGNCKTDYRQGCDCPADTRGFSCEFVLSESAGTSSSGEAPSSTIVDEVEDAECDLDCSGRGVCRNGIKDISDLGDATNANHLSYTHDDFQHCVCVDGWTGINCEHEITNCDTNGHFCLHGSECVEESSGLCDCSKADSDIADNFAGDHCEHTADVCISEVGNPTSYCANGGKCKSTTDRVGIAHPGCDCLDGFTGERCEFTINKGPHKSTQEGTSTSRSRGGSGGSLGGLGITAIILSVCAVLAVLMFMINSCVRRKRFSRRRDGESSGIIWANKKGYKDTTETINFSPKAGYRDDYMASFATPSRDPMATAFAPDMGDHVAPASDTSAGPPEDDDETQIFIGPPTDEDGHVLHNVDIL